MDLKKLAPWNWFKKEDESNEYRVPVKRSNAGRNEVSYPTALSSLHDEIDRLFDAAFQGFGISPVGSKSKVLEGMPGRFLKPRLDLSATEKEYSIEIEIPGVNENDVSVELVNDTLTIRGEKKQETEESGKTFYRLERSYGAFQRILSLPEDADQNDINATFKNGILLITMPRKSVPKSNAKQIEIKSAA